MGTAYKRFIELYRAERHVEAATFAVRLADTYGPDQPGMARFLANLAELFRIRGRFAEAVVFQTKALTIRETALGPEHIEVAADVNKLALLYKKLGRPIDSERLYRRAVAILNKVRKLPPIPTARPAPPPPIAAPVAPVIAKLLALPELPAPPPPKPEVRPQPTQQLARLPEPPPLPAARPEPPPPVAAPVEPVIAKPLPDLPRPSPKPEVRPPPTQQLARLPEPPTVLKPAPPPSVPATAP
ncbi:MAG: tetratricopeptide repeat protein [Alphaproteobacteria bacterium]|jgi:hypothetical protein|nr:tetratricopeptide repeat protein [Alphaproteobacteria bacterium]